MKITLPFPPSTNGYWRSVSKGPLAGRVLISEKGRAYRKEVEGAVYLQHARFRLAGTVAVEVIVFPPDRRRRDLDNAFKGLLDAMTHAGVWNDDSQIDDLRIRRARDANGEIILGNRVEVSITILRDE